MMMLIKIDAAAAEDDVIGNNTVGEFGGHDDENVEDDVTGEGDEGDNDDGDWYWC